MIRKSLLTLTFATMMTFLAVPEDVSAQAMESVEPYKVGTFAINDVPTVGLVVRDDQYIVDLAAANRALELSPSYSHIAMPADMLGLIEQYEYGLKVHLLTWAVLDVQRLDRVWADIVKRPYITVGMVAFVALIPLAATSNNWSVRRLGARWRKLQKLAYPIGVMGAVHYLLLVKGWQLKPMFFLALILLLLALRLKLPARRQQA